MARRAIGVVPLALVLALPAGAQTMDHRMMRGMTMPGMTMPAPKGKPAAKAKPRRPAPQPRRALPTRPAAAPDPHAGHDMSAMPEIAPAADPHHGHDMSAMPGMAMGRAPQGGDAPAAGTDLPPGDAAAPPAQPGLLAERVYGAAAMREADQAMRREHGGMTFAQVIVNLAEYQARRGRDGYRWDGEAWIGGDIDRLTIKTEGEGEAGGALATAEVQALYSRALDPYWNLQAGIRHDIRPGPSRSYATIGVEGLAPYWFDVEAAVFLSDRGDALARVAAWYDQRITQYWVLQPRLEANVAAQDMPAQGIGSGLSDMELGLRLRYERVREFAPYVGLSWDRRFGQTADLARDREGGIGGISVVAGVRTWF
ncbi:copper resistance protein B [Sphingomonas ginsenosidimutans]|uniref:copper resistance protein B n=3 Tax=Sphingomonas TaxID=13687 RepID=UPI001DC90FB1|nr:copper resistance protein B [Sphingomonas ginsenosidimutans]MBY0302673.1 copper resistance protein B [Sphingomonas ginsenosidimutans]